MVQTNELFQAANENLFRYSRHFKPGCRLVEPLKILVRPENADPSIIKFISFDAFKNGLAVMQG